MNLLFSFIRIIKLKGVDNMLEGILGLVGLGFCVFAKLAENDFDVEKIMDDEIKKQDEVIERKFKEFEKNSRK